MRSRNLRLKLKGLGLTDEVIDLAWPSWWDSAAESSASAQAELRFALARKLGLDARALVDSDEPQFIWRTATFKSLAVTSQAEKDAIVSYGTSVARLVISATEANANAPRLSASDIRRTLLKKSQVVGLSDILSFCWAIGVPTIHIKVFPLRAKRMCAMAVKVQGRYAILLAKESKYPAQLAYHIAHELGHIMLGHLDSQPAVVDMEDPLSASGGADPDEVAADQFALEVLTGEPMPKVLTEAQQYSAAALADAVLGAAAELQIEAGTLALCFGHSTGRWDKAFASLNRIYPNAVPVSMQVNRVALSQIAHGALPDEANEYLMRVTGVAH